VFCQFHTFDLFIKYRATRYVLLSGRICHGLYCLELTGVSLVFSGFQVSSSQWHARLDHTATPITRHELRSISSNKDLAVCDASKARGISLRFLCLVKKLNIL
jgi:hypothetical protein